MPKIITRADEPGSTGHMLRLGRSGYLAGTQDRCPGHSDLR